MAALFDALTLDFTMTELAFTPALRNFYAA